MNTPPCAVPGCRRVAYARGICRPHYRQWARGTLGKARPREELADAVKITVHIERVYHEALDRIAAKKGITYAALVREAVKRVVEAP